MFFDAGNKRETNTAYESAQHHHKAPDARRPGSVDAMLRISQRPAAVKTRQLSGHREAGEAVVESWDA